MSNVAAHLASLKSSKCLESASLPIVLSARHTSSDKNLTIRIGMRRLTRLTNAFSKKVENLYAAYALHFAYYNFCRIHKTLRCTPAMEAGITKRLWELKDLLTA